MQADERIMAQRCNGFQWHVEASLNGPFIFLFQRDLVYEADGGRCVEKDPQ